ncbi:JAB domain-containing protein [Pseudomonas aeruginosa]|uniref:JAB domain-containing protein n=1 Tax=Stutzerimonas balearica TaxID=74829 RepID=UPI003D6CC53F
MGLLERRIFKAGPYLGQPAAVREYLRLKLVAEPNEIFAVVFMNSMHEVLAYEPMFKGTVHSTTVHARPIVQRALELNAAAVVLAHQHPSGATEPSNADRVLTQQLQAALALIDVRVLDHIIVGQGAPFSFAESGLL